MPTDHHYTRQTTNGRPVNGSVRPDASTHSAYSQSAYTQNNPTQRKYDSHQDAYRAAGTARSGYAQKPQYSAAYEGVPRSSYSKKKKKSFSLKRVWKKLKKKLFVVQTQKPQMADSYPKTSERKPQGNGGQLKKHAKKTFLSVVRAAARGLYLGIRGIYNFLMSLPPRILLVASSAFGLVVLTVIILAIALPGKHSSADAQEQLATFAAEENIPAVLDSGTVDPYAENAAVDALDTTADTMEDASVDASGEQTKAAVFTQQLKEGDNDAVIATIQSRLMELGYMDSDEPTQHFGPLTQSALTAFQRHNGLDDDGICGQATYDLLMNADAKIYVMQIGDSGPDVEGVQQRLYELGYLDNKANIQGTFGEKTEEAAKQFQKKNDLTADGKVGVKTLEMLYGEDVVSNAYKLGDENPVIKECQTVLKKLGYITFKPDGVMGKATVTGIKAFQQANGLTRDGCLGPVTRDLLLSGDAQEMVLQLGDYGTAVKNMQARLAKLNYLSSANATGYFGEITEDAVKAFQKRSGLTQDGKVGAVTLTMINSSSAKKAVTSPSTSKESSSSSSSSSGSSSSGSSSSGSVASASNKTGVEKLVALAESKIGSKYVRGAKGPNTFDCSGFVYWCLKNSGVSTSYMTSIAWRTTSRYQRISSIGSIERGDILVFSGETSSTGHVGIYLGGGSMIDASSSEGQVRRSSTVLSSGGYWSKHFICAYRVF